MLGGIARRETAIKELKDQKPHFFLLHNGALTKDFGVQPQMKRDVQEKALNEIGVNAMGVGVSEFILGAASLIRFEKKAKFPLLNANIVDPQKMLRFQKEWSQKIQFENSLLTLKVVSLLSEKEQKELQQLIPDLTIDPVQSQIDKWKEQKKEGEFWVLLFQGPAYEAQNLARKETLFDLIVYSRRGDVPIYQKIGETPVVSTGSKGRYFIALDFDAEPPHNIKRTQRITLDKRYADGPKASKWLASYKLKLKKNKIADGYPKVAWPNGATYVGSRACAECHQVQYEVWKNSKHSHAVEPLKEENHHYDPECLQCHTTGFPFKGGYENLKKTPELAAVTCESCHGPRSLHVEAPTENVGPQVTANNCIQCHDAENSPHFDFETYWPKIEHN